MTMPATSLVETQPGRESPVGPGSSLAFAVAGLRVEMHSAPGGPPLAAPSTLEAFAAGACPAGIELSIHWADEIPAPAGPAVFDSGGVWTLHHRESGYEFAFRSPAWGDTPYKLARMDENFRRGQVWLSRRVFGARPAVYPLEYPLDELLVIHRLSRGEGVEVHACGVVDACGRGLLFTGHSGAGKSTLARLWAASAGVCILSDDRIILRRGVEGNVSMHGTPWHGEARLALPLAAPLCGVYVLEHARAGNEIERLAPGQAAAELMSRSFLPFHDASGLEFALQFFAGVVGEVNCSSFRFLPDASAVREIEGHV